MTDLAGTGYYYGHCYYFGYTADFWSSTEVNSDYAWKRRLSNSASNVGWFESEKYYGFLSVAYAIRTAPLTLHNLILLNFSCFAAKLTPILYSLRESVPKGAV